MRREPESDTSNLIELSVIIPVYNEEAIVEASITELVSGLETRPRLKNLRYELIISANGCFDQTVPRVRELQKRFPKIRLLEMDEPNYGKALRRGILAAEGEIVVCDEIDLCDLDFYEAALDAMEAEGWDLVVGSKRLRESKDRRPLFRRVASTGVTKLLWLATGFRGTDTHGLKALRRQAILPIVHQCVVDKDMFASELVIRTHQDAALKAGEIPIELVEKRAPSIHLMRRVPTVLRQLVTLAWVTRVQRHRN